MKSLLKRTAVKLAIVGGLIGLALVALFARSGKMNIKESLLKIGAAILFFMAGYFYGNYKCEEVIKEVPVVKEVIVDTCKTYIEKCRITRQDSLAIYREIARARKKKKYTTIEKEDVTKTVKVDTVPPHDTTYTSTFDKRYDWGLVRLGIKIDAHAECPVEFDNYSIEYELDTLKIKEKYTVTETVILEPEVKERTVYRYVNVPDNKIHVLVGGGAAVVGSDVRPILSTGARIGNTTALLHFSSKGDYYGIGVVTPILSFKRK